MPGGFDQLTDVLQSMFRAILTRNNIAMRDIEMGVLGLAGVDTTEQHQIISGILENLGLERFILCNDSYLGIKAGSEKGYGVCAINGTGCSITAMDSKGGTIQVGGLGTLSGDVGGTNVLVPIAMGMVHDQLFREKPFTSMTTAVFRWLDITDRNDFIDLLTEKYYSDSRNTRFELCRILHTAARDGDEMALSLLERSGDSYAGGIAAAIESLAFEKDEAIDVVFAGSLFTKADSDHAQKTAEKLLSKRFSGQRKLIFHKLDVPCAAGAVLWALNGLGIHDKRESVMKLFRGGVWLR
jgi:N-acetylglucosamine kinase-like BadF-type ATPase